MLPKSPPVRSPKHLEYIRTLPCAIGNDCFGQVVPAHTRRRTNGGMSMKPGDNWTIPLCDKHHSLQHRIGEQSFEKMFGISMKEIAEKHWNERESNAA